MLSISGNVDIYLRYEAADIELIVGHIGCGCVDQSLEIHQRSQCVGEKGGGGEIGNLVHKDHYQQADWLAKILTATR